MPDETAKAKRSRRRALSVVLAIAIPALLVAFAPALAADDDYLLMPRAELLSLPTSGSAWDSLRKVADSPWGTPDLCDRNLKHGTKALGGALVYARTGVDGYSTKTRDAIMSAIGTERADCSILSIARQLGSYGLAADFIKLGGSDDEQFRRWLSAMRTRTFSEHPRWQTLVGTHRDSANNFGAFAGASRIAASLYLGDGDDVAQAAAVLRGFLGDRDAWAGFRGQGRTNGSLEDTVRVWACDGSAEAFVPINPDCTKLGVSVDGAIVNDVSRDDLGLTWPVGRTGIGYTLESLQGLVLQAELLYRNGYAGAWNWSDAALRRVARLVTRNGLDGGGTWNLSSVNYHVPWILNFRYGKSLPTRSAGYGRTFGYTDWLYGARTATEVAAQGESVVPPSSPATVATTKPTPAATPKPTSAATPSPTTTPAPSASAGATPKSTPPPSRTPKAPKGPHEIGFRSASSATSTSNSLRLTRPSGVVAGDVLIAVIDVRENQRHKLSAPAGWSLVRQDALRRTITKAVYVRVATASEPGSYTFTASRAAASNGIVLALTGVDPNNPIAASSGLGAKSSTSIMAPAVSAAGEGWYIVGLYATTNDTKLSAPTGMTRRAGVTQPSSLDALTSAVTTQRVRSGDTGDRVARAAQPGDNIGQLLLLRLR